MTQTSAIKSLDEPKVWGSTRCLKAGAGWACPTGKSWIAASNSLMASTLLILTILIFRNVFSGVSAASPEKPAPPQAPGTTLSYNFDQETAGAMPAKFHAARTGQGSEGKWAVTTDPTAPSKPNVVAQTSTDKTDYRFPLLISDEGTFKDLEL